MDREGRAGLRDPVGVRGFNRLLHLARRHRHRVSPEPVEAAGWMAADGSWTLFAGAPAERPPGRVIPAERSPGHWLATGPPNSEEVEAALRVGLSSLWISCGSLSEEAAARLSRAGVPVHGGAAGPVRELQRGPRFLRWTGRPLVTLKVAATLDGRIATAGGDSRWVTSGWSRRRARRLRSEHDAVAVGIGTALEDDPRLLVGGPEPEPLRLVLDARGRLPVDGQLVRTLDRGPVAVASVERSPGLERAGVQTIRCRPAPGGGVDPSDLLCRLAERGIASLWIEGGGRVLGSFVEAGCVDRVEWFAAPKLLGGDGRPAVGGSSPLRMADALQLERPRVRRLGPDLWLSAWVSGRQPPGP
mgnify:CR=1 FL=1